MGVFRSAAGTELHYELRGDGPLLVCQPGGPGRPGGYLDDLGGVHRTLLLLDPRGAGRSEPAPSHASTTSASSARRPLADSTIGAPVARSTSTQRWPKRYSTPWRSAARR